MMFSNMYSKLDGVQFWLSTILMALKSGEEPSKSTMYLTIAPLRSLRMWMAPPKSSGSRAVGRRPHRVHLKVAMTKHFPSSKDEENGAEIRSKGRLYELKTSRDLQSCHLPEAKLKGRIHFLNIPR